MPRLSFGLPSVLWLYCCCGAAFEKLPPIHRGINLPSVISLVGGLSSATTYSTASFFGRSGETAKTRPAFFDDYLYKKAGAIYTAVINCGPPLFLSDL